MASPPHIVIFNPDQWRGDVMGHLGDPAALTPTLDALVEREAVSFRVAACQNPVCTPSRCSFMSGWYPHVRGHRTMFHMLRSREGDPNLLAVLKNHGYRVWWGGKNDLTPAQHGYADDCEVHYRPSRPPRPMWMTDRQEVWRGAPGSDTYYSFYVGRLDSAGEPFYYDGDWANVLGAVEYIRTAPKDRPLCLYLPLTYPHPPYGVEEPWYSLIDRDRLPPRAPTPSDWNGKASILKGIYEGQGLQQWTEDRWRELRAVYYGMCARLDHQLRLVLNALREAGIYDDTALFFFADHGDYTGDYGIVEKTQNTFEDALSRVPFVIKPPAGVPLRPRVSEALVELVDFPATVYAMAGIEPGYWHFGRSLLPVLAGETDEHRDAIFCEGGRLEGEIAAMERASVDRMADPSRSLYWPRIRLQITDEQPWHTKATMCRTRDHKYIRRLGERDELYDLRLDPRECDNRIDDPAYGDILARLRDRMLTWYQETADVVPFEQDARW
ncbi:MAG: sulfatase-like hydrolase/transferase [Lentisphaeria bacterium]|nr:sulfatase-like hydrolase/transferase [Lentisphaeria bacterium]